MSSVAFVISPSSVKGNNAFYLQLWMGTHPNGPSSVKIPGQPEESLENWLKQNPDALGSRMKDYFKGALPFLFKVLSVNNSLSIQAHPNKVTPVSNAFIRPKNLGRRCV